MLEAPGRETARCRFGPASIEAAACSTNARGLPVEKRSSLRSRSDPAAWGALGRAAEKFSATSRLHFSDWMVPPQASGLVHDEIHDLGPLRFSEKT